jgi:hypothetical protein
MPPVVAIAESMKSASDEEETGRLMEELELGVSEA